MWHAPFWIDQESVVLLFCVVGIFETIVNRHTRSGHLGTKNANQFIWAPRMAIGELVRNLANLANSAVQKGDYQTLKGEK
jgi:hypothetical protein